MKKLFFLTICTVWIYMGIYAQAPAGFNYQAVVRDATGDVISNQQVGLMIAIIQGSADGGSVYEEVFFPVTNDFGLINIQIGSGSPLHGNFTDISWSEGPFFIHLQVDPDGGVNFVDMGTSQLISVPFALHAMTSADTFSGDYEDLENLPDLSNMVSLQNPQTGDLLYYGSNGWMAIPIGDDGEILTIKDGMPQWADPSEDTLTDIDGNTYQTVVINDVEWMAENLRVTHYNNGDAIPHVTVNSDWANLTTGAYCVYGNNPDNAPVYGKLYNWYAVDDERGLCPAGWRVPTDDEFLDLMQFLDPDGIINTNNAGGKMKAPGNLNDGNGLWSPPNITTNESGFTALPGGARFPTQGVFGGLHDFAYFWTSTPTPSDVLQRAWNWYVTYNSTTLYRNNYSRVYGHSVRCIKD